VGKLAVLNERIEALTARRELLRAREKRQARADDTRRKILLGACLLAGWADGVLPEEWRARLDRYLTRPRDRELFGL
jgi:hypothetical protein